MNPNALRIKQSEAAYYKNEEFNTWLDKEYSGLEITDDDRYYFYKPASEVLFQVDNELYWEIFNLEFGSKRQGFITEVIQTYPTSIAFYIYQVEKGFENHGQRLRYLRDIWESFTYLLYAIVLGEVVLIGLPLGDNSLNMDKLLSDKISTRLNTIETIFEISQRKDIKLESARLISSSTISKLRSLNGVRNKFSHNFTENELTAKEIYQKYVDKVYDLLADAKELGQVSIFRLGKDVEDYSTPRCMLFRGENLHSGYEVITLTDEQIVSATQQKILNRKIILAIVEDKLFSLSPFLHFDERGGETRPCFYKQKIPDDKFSFAVTGQPEPIEYSRASFQIQLDVLRSLLSKT